MTAHDCTASRCSDVARRAHESRVAQGLPACNDDPLVYDEAVQVLEASAARRRRQTRRAS